ncbi:hypothetical protein EA472_04070 [Natrarchaeobius oligotrophus]|uniref:Uncharacterized protein n=1 Tax=Natrarchaeobius chitinivorans TaxID=1679083 RepID=A0A3N6N439_NATCH|nr:hypothetical protein EA472_04070 [Natrarchaeobius chitinivorans]
MRPIERVTTGAVARGIGSRDDDRLRTDGTVLDEASERNSSSEGIGAFGSDRPSRRVSNRPQHVYEFR